MSSADAALAPLAPLRPSPLASCHLLLTGLFVLALAWFPICSVDIGCHIVYGRWMIQHHRALEVDPYIYGAHEQHFVNQNWLTQVLLAWLFDRFDWPALIAMRVVLIAITFAGIAGVMRAGGAGPHAIAWAWLAAAVGSYERFTLRPELCSYAMMLAQLWLLTRGPPPLKGGAQGVRPSTAALIAIPLLQALWINLHSYSWLGIAMTGAFAAGALVSRLRRTATASQSSLPRWLLLLVLQAAACLVNPWGMRGALFPLRTVAYLSSEKIMAQSPDAPAQSAWGIISEFHSPFGFFKLHDVACTTYAYPVLLGIGAIGLVAALVRGRIGAALTILMMALASTQMRRNIPLLALVGVPLAIAALVPQTTSKRHGPRTLGVVATLALLIAWLGGIWSGRFYYLERRPDHRLAAGWDEQIFPFAALRWINEHPQVQPRLFSDLMATSNVLPWLPAGMQVFITTNTFACPPEQLMRCWNVGTGVEDHRRFFDEYGVNIALLRAYPPTLPLIRALADDPDWALVHLDTTYVVFIRRIAAHAALIARCERKPADLDPQRWIAAAPQPHAVTGYRLGTIAAVPICLGWFDRARPLLEEAVRLEPSYFEAWNNLGLCRVQQGNVLYQARSYNAALVEYRAAIQCFENVLNLDPGNTEARRNRDKTPVSMEQRP